MHCSFFFLLSILTLLQRGGYAKIYWLCCMCLVDRFLQLLLILFLYNLTIGRIFLRMMLVPHGFTPFIMAYLLMNGFCLSSHLLLKIFVANGTYQCFDKTSSLGVSNKWDISFFFMEIISKFCILYAHRRNLFLIRPPVKDKYRVDDT